MFVTEGSAGIMTLAINVVLACPSRQYIDYTTITVVKLWSDDIRRMLVGYKLHFLLSNVKEFGVAL